MRLALLYNPRLLCERLAVESQRHRRLARLSGTPASKLSLGHIDSLELIELVRGFDIRVIYDIGANVGTWTLLAASVMPGARIHAFEPLPKHCASFTALVPRSQNVTLHQVALGAGEKDVELVVTDFSDASSLLLLTNRGQSTCGIREVGRLPIRLTILDRYREEHQLPWPDLIKLDVQGYEIEVIKGGRNCLTNAKAVIAEVSFVEFYAGQCLFDDVVQVMSECGFQLYAFGVNTALGKPLQQADALFLRHSVVVDGGIGRTQ